MKQIEQGKLIVWVSYDYDGVVQFWKNRPEYNDDVDEFSGEEMAIRDDVAEYLTDIASDMMDFGNAEKFYVVEDEPVIKMSGEAHTERELAYALAWDFRRLALLLGKALDEEEMKDIDGSSFGLDIEDLACYVIKDFDGGVPLCDGQLMSIVTPDCVDNNIAAGEAGYEVLPNVDWKESDLEEAGVELIRYPDKKINKMSDFDFGEQIDSVCQFKYIRRRPGFIETSYVSIEDINTDNANGHIDMIELRDWIYSHIVFIAME